jgi:hypothetical protein
VAPRPSCSRCGSEFAVERGHRARYMGWGSKIAPIYLCGVCWHSGRPLSPYEFLTGERFWDHLSEQDRELDRLLLKQQTANIVDRYLGRPRSSYVGNDAARFLQRRGEKA